VRLYNRGNISRRVLPFRRILNGMVDQVDRSFNVLRRKGETMKEKLLGEWITALRSGVYTQIQCRIQDPEVPHGYCCLGVLSVITSHTNSEGVLIYPDCTICTDNHVDIPPVSEYANSMDFIKLNDEGPLDNYSRVLWLLETAPELFITE